jgi:RNA polymerase-binding transcription factor DksA
LKKIILRIERMDDVDLASIREEAAMFRALQNVSRSVVANILSDGPVFCQDCDDESPSARIKAAPFTKKCINCQSASEFRRK